MKVYTIEECAKIMHVAPRTAAKWFDSGRLCGYKLPGTNDRRVPEEYLLKFLRTYGLPIPDHIKPASPVDIINETIDFYRNLTPSDCNTAAIAALQSVLQKLGADPISKETGE